MKHVFLIWGTLSEILSDLGTEYTNEIIVELCALLGIDKIRSSGYRPQTSGLIEVWHRILHSVLANVISENQRNWCEFVGYVTFAYNSIGYSSTGFSPFYLMTGHEANWNVDLPHTVSTDSVRSRVYSALVVDHCTDVCVY